MKPDLSAAGARRPNGAAHQGGPGARPPEAVAFEREYPGASWAASRLVREVERIGGLLEARVASVARRHDLSHAALNALAVIEGNGTPMAAGEVGTRMHITSGTMTSVLDTLERKGFVVRLTDPADRRRVLVDVTPAGQAVLDRVLPDVQLLCRVLVDASGLDDHAPVFTALAALEAALDALPDELPPALPRRTPTRLRRRAQPAP